MFHKRSQIWGVDILAATAIFFVSLFFFYQYYVNAYSAKGGDITPLIQTSRTVSESLIEAGYPEGWNSTNVVMIGLTDGNQRMDYNKLSYFSEIDYEESKKLLNTQFDYLIFFYDSNGVIASIDDISSVGKPGVTYDNVIEHENPEKLIKVSRFLIYKSDVYRMELYLWS